MKLFDSHCHLQFPQFSDDREEIVSRLKQADIKIVNVGTNLEDSRKAVELTEKYPDIMWASTGVHPNDANSEIDFNEFKQLARDEKVVAIGECGLDYFRIMNNESGIREKQKKTFTKQVELAKELKKPVVLHCRPSFGTQDACEDAIDIIENLKFKIENCGNGVAHFFSGSKETARKFLDLGFYISFAGPITFPPKAGQPRADASEYKEIVEFVPMDKILVETDAPFAAPVPYRGKRNEPAYVEFIARQIAEWKGVSFDKVAVQTHNNAKALFKI